MGRRKLDFLDPKVGNGSRLCLRGEAVNCLRRFRDLIGDMAESAWVRFVRRLPRNQGLLGAGPGLHQFLFGSDRTTLGVARNLLLEVEGSRCFYCGDAISGEPAVDPFVPWAATHWTSAPRRHPGMTQVC